MIFSKSSASHSCFSVQVADKILLFDPFITGNILAKNIDLAKLMPDYILISHGHFDHIDDAVEIAKSTSAQVIANFEISNWLNRQGVTNVHILNPGGVREFDFGVVKCFFSQHSSSFPDGTYAGVASGFCVASSEGNFYYSGDAALSLDMQLVSKWAQLDFAVLPIGDKLTMGVTEAIEVAKLLDVWNVIGVHFDTFPDIVIDHNQAYQSFIESNIRLTLLEIDEHVHIPIGL